jgi:hypothetical protein
LWLYFFWATNLHHLISLVYLREQYVAFKEILC